MCVLLFIVNPRTTPVAEMGVINLHDHDFKTDGCIMLHGEWAFYWDQVVNESTFVSITDQAPDLYVSVPSFWNELSRVDSRIKPRGVATYNLKMLKDFENETDTFAIRAYNITPNADIYVDGRRISEIGDVDANREKSVPGNKSVLMPIRTGSDSMTITISISNYHGANGGLNRPICFGPYENLLAFREKHLTIDSIFLGGLLIMALYQFSILILRKRRIAPLYLGLLVLLSFLFAGLRSEMALLTIFPNWDGEIRFRIISLAFSLTGSVFSLYYSSLYPSYFHPKLERYILSAVLIMILAAVFIPMEVYSKFMLPLKLVSAGFIIHTISMLVLALRKTKDSLIMFLLFGAEMLVFGVILGFIDDNTQTAFQSISGVFFVFSVYHTVLEARICSNAFVQVDRLSTERQRLERQNMDFFTQIFIDKDTDLYNKVLLNNFLQAKWTTDSLENGHSVSMILADVDFFGAYRNAYGHEQSENIIVRLSKVIMHRNKVGMKQPVLARYGENAFAMILMESIDEFSLYRRADELRALVESESIEHRFAGNSKILTISVGCATITPSKDNKPGVLIDLANRALRLAKRNGRNRTEIITA